MICPNAPAFSGFLAVPLCVFDVSKIRENLNKLHAEAPAGSRLKYVCVIAYVTPDGEEQLFEGTCEGTLAQQPNGEGGFGYDPLFIPDEAPGRTMAELSDEEKDAISHRGHAARHLLAWLHTR